MKDGFDSLEERGWRHVKQVSRIDVPKSRKALDYGTTRTELELI